MHVRVRVAGLPDVIIVVESKLTKIKDFKTLVRKKYSVPPEFQLLFYGGKLLEDSCTFHDYNIKLNDVIQLMEKSRPSSSKSNDSSQSSSSKSSPKQEETTVQENVQMPTDFVDTENELYKVGDLVDVKEGIGSWVEGVIIRIVLNQNTATTSQGSSQSNENSTVNKTEESNILYITKLEHDDTAEPLLCDLSKIRPRARSVIEPKDLKVGQTVMINYNIDEPDKVGDWYDFKVEEIKQMKRYYQITGTLHHESVFVPSQQTIKVKEKIFIIEKPVPLAERSEQHNKLFATATPKRNTGIMCNACKDDSSTPCRECGCSVCASKESPSMIILCDECDHGFHLNCLNPPLTNVPVEDWYCPSCKRDPTEVIAPGGSKQTRKTSGTKKTRDWGRGMACVGKTKTSDMPPDHFGPIPGMEVGMSWRYRMQISETGLHRPMVSGIHGRDSIGAFSIVLSGGYEDDVDHGNEFAYSGSGGRDLSGNKRTAVQSRDQKFARENRALARNCASGKVSEKGGNAGDDWRNGKPVRVMRSYKMRKTFPKYAPPEGIRYDGIYKVVKYYPERGLSGFRVYKYLLRRDDPNPAPWEPNAKKYPIIYPDGYLEAQAQKKKNKGKSGKSVSKKTKAPKGSTTGALKRALEAPEAHTSARRMKFSESVDEAVPGTSSEPDGTHLGESSRGNNSLGESSRGNDNLGESSRGNDSRSDDSEMPASSIKGKGKGKGKGKKTVAKNPNQEENNVNGNDIDMDAAGPSNGHPAAAVKDKKDDNNKTISATTMNLIKADKLNTKLWKECIEIGENLTMKEFIEHVMGTFRCIICQGLVISPVTTTCLHNFCLTCLKRSFKAMEAKTCPHCRHNLEEFDPETNPKLQEALRAILPGYDAKK